MKKIIIFMFLFPIVVIAQIDSLEYLNYYPLHIGDKWVYEEISFFCDFIDTAYIVEEIIGDTVMPNGKIYFTKTDGYYYRIDTTSFCIYRYSVTENIVFNISPFDSDIDSSYLKNTTSNSDSILIIRSHESGNAGYIQGQFEKIKYINNIVVPTTYELTKGIGISQFNYYEVGGCEKTLLGARIDGIEYGNMNEISHNNEIPNKYRLYPNFPNPFNVNTKIRYEIQKSGNVTIQIFDVNGKLFEIIQNSRQDAGQYSINWNASNYSTGIYIIQMKVGEFTQSRKCLLLK